MKLPKKIAALLTVTLVASSSVNLGYADTTKAVSEDKLVGAGRWETAIEVSKKGWTKSDKAVIVNDNAIADALAATPFAEAENAPILLTGKDKLNEKTKEELKRLGVKKVYVIGGENTLTKNIETELKALNIEIDRIQGATRELTALAIAERLDKIKDISEIAVVNGYTGLADAVSIAAVAADKDMAIILSNSTEGTKASDEFINKEDIKTSYVIGGPNTVSNEVLGKLPNAKRINGMDRNETNAKVLEAFYTEKELDNAYVAKDGMGKEDHLIDALAVGVLAAKNDSPVIIVGNKLNQMQKDVTNTKSFKTVTQIGGNGNETAFGELKTMQAVTTYNVTTVKELNEALAKADANDIINVKSLNDNSRNQNTEIKSENAITINIDSTSEKTLSIDIKNGTVKIYENQTIIYMESGELVIEGTVSTVSVVEGGDVTIINESTSKPNVTVAEGASVEVDGKFNNITVNGKDAEVSVGKDSTVNKIQINSGASGTVIDNDGKVDKVVSNASDVTVENSGTVGNVSGSNKPSIDNTGGGTVNPPSNGGGSSGGGIVQTPSISDIGVNISSDTVTVTANIKNYGSNNVAKVELLQGTTVIKSQENADILEGQLNYTFSNVANGTYTVKVTVGSTTSTSKSFVLNVWNGTTKTEVKPNKDGIYEVSSPDELAWISDFVNEGNTNISIELMNNIDLNNKEWTPIGTSSKHFRGSFDGGSYTIKNLSINKADGSDLGLFGYTNSGINVKNVTLDGVNIVGHERIGSLVGSIFDEQTSNNREEIIENCHVKNVNINAKLKDAGGLVGYGYVDIKDCSVDKATVIADRVDGDGDNVGGAIGYLASARTVSNVKVNDVTLSGERKVGGVAGSANNSDIVFENCEVTGKTSIDVTNSKASYAFAGGIIGESVQLKLTVKDCSVDKETVIITGDNSNTLGWFVGGAGTRDGKPVEVGDINFEGSCKFADNVFAWDGKSKAEVTPVNGVYEITSPSQLAWIADFVNQGNTTISIKLMNDIDLNNKEWSPIGTSSKHFRGSFDGGSYTIKNLSINKADGSDLGLFGYTNSGINVKNVTLDGVNIVGNQRIGSLVGSIFDEGTSSTREEIIENCHVKNANLTAKKKDVAGLVGYGYVDIIDCSVDEATIITERKSLNGDNVGGAIGYLASERIVSNVKVNNVTLIGERKVGGIAGSANDANIVFENCEVTGKTSIEARAEFIPQVIYPFAGGIVGESVQKGITIKDCSVDKSTVAISGKNNNLLGWFVGGSRANNGESLKDGDINFVGNSFDENIIQ